MATKKYQKIHFPLSKLKGREFLSRPLGCKGVGFSLVRFKPGEGAQHTHRHRVQEEIYMALRGSGTIILDGRRHSMPEGTIVRVSPPVYRAIGNDSKRDAIFLVMGGVAPKKFPQGGRTLFGDGIPDRSRVPKWGKR